MKRILYLLALIVFVASCRQKDHKVFVVKGEILNAPGKKVILMETPYGNEQPVILDSVFLTDKGVFSLKGRANEEGIYRLVLERGPDVILINDNDEINLHLDVNDYRNYTVEGSPASESLHKLFEDYHSKDSAILVNFKKIDSIQKIPGNDSSAEMMKSANDRRVEELNSLVNDFIKNNNSPSAVMYVLGIASRTISQEELKNRVNEAAARFPKHKGLAAIKNMMAMRKTAPESKPTETVTNNYALLDKQAPDLAMPGLNGKTVSIKSFRGKYLLVDFWASWCGPCRQENPNVVAAYNRFKNKNFAILGVSLDQDKDAWQAAVLKDGLSWNHMSDLKQWQSDAVAAYGIEGIPFNVLLDPSGKIIASGLREEQLQQKLEEVLK